MSSSPRRIDLHTHSTCSDGTDSVTELLHAARAAGLDAIALTDHDTTVGWAEAAAAVPAAGVDVVPGIEVSTERDAHSIHVLALLPDPSEQTSLAEEILHARRSRDDRARRMVELLGRDLPLRWEDVVARTAGEATTIGRPHIADALVERGVVADRGEAFEKLLRPGGPYYVGHYAPDPVRAVQVIREAGGVPVLAHPGSGSRGQVIADAVIAEMIAAGLAGLEIDHREHDEATRSRLTDTARSHGLLVTGGSDYHGAGKPNRLGENLTSPDVLAALIASATSSTEVLTA